MFALTLPVSKVWLHSLCRIWHVQAGMDITSAGAKSYKLFLIAGICPRADSPSAVFSYFSIIVSTNLRILVLQKIPMLPTRPSEKPALDAEMVGCRLLLPTCRFR